MRRCYKHFSEIVVHIDIMSINQAFFSIALFVQLVQQKRLYMIKTEAVEEEKKTKKLQTPGIKQLLHICVSCTSLYLSAILTSQW